jgi:hypothetical protein
MPNAQGRSSTGKAERSPLKRRSLSFSQHAEQLKRDEAHLFDDYDSTLLAQEMLSLLYPKGVEHENVVLEGFECLFRQNRRYLDPGFEAQVQKRRREIPTTSTPQVGEMLTAVLGVLTVKTKMRDGRFLGQWTFGEFRKEYKAMSELVLRYADLGDDELMGDHL